MTTILRIDPAAPEEKDISFAADVLRKGQVVAYPTETIYGLGANVLDRKAVKRVYDLKARDYGLPISILVSDFSMVHTCAATVSDEALLLIRRFWPGPLTILFPASKKIPAGLITNTGKVGVRMSSHPIAAALVKAFGGPVTTTSANLHDYPPSLSARHVEKYFGEKIPCIIDGGVCPPSIGSTVVDVTEESMRIIREGAIPSEEIITCFQNR